MSDVSAEGLSPADRAAALRARLGGSEQALLVRAPGRVNLIGEHTDYNEGFVLPAAIDREIWIAYEPWDKPAVELTSAELKETRSFAFDDLSLETPRTRSWIDYVAGTAWAMRESGLPLQGFRGALDSTIPVGSGLSSSAALEMASTWALAAPRVGQRRSGHALLIDCRSNEFEATPMPAGLSIVVCDTGSPHRLDATAYNARRFECEVGARLIAEREPGVKSLRDVDEAMLERNRSRLPELVGRRCEHIVLEDARVMATVAALRDGDLDALGRLFAASHASLRDLFEVSSPELDAMVEIARAVPGVIASRMTGAGFGGCTVNLVRFGAEDALRERVLAEYPARTGLTGRVFVAAAVDGASPVSLDG